MYFIKPADPNPITPLSAGLLLLLCLVWLLTGLIGHDPWNPDEPVVLGVVYAMLVTDNWLIPTLVDQPHLHYPPLYYWTAALFARVFLPWLELHDAARLASGFYMGLTLLFVGLAGRRLYGEGRGWGAVICLIGCMGLLVRAHQMQVDLVLLAGCAMWLYGFSYVQEHWRRAALWLGVGLGIGFLAKGFVAPLWFVLIALLLSLVTGRWRDVGYWRTIAMAWLVALPWLLVWPFWLYLDAPGAFELWLWQHNLDIWLHPEQWLAQLSPGYYLLNLGWFAWPAFPLALWLLWHARRTLKRREDLQLPLVMLLVMLVTLSLAPDPKVLWALPMLLPFALLAAASLTLLRRGAANALYWFGLMTFVLLALFIWWGWAGLLLDNNAKITRLLKDLYPNFEPVVNGGAFMLALLACVLWLVLVWRNKHSMRRAVLNWSGGMTLIWVLAMSLWLPWLDSGKSYRGVVLAMKQAMPSRYQCVGYTELNQASRAMLHYFGGIAVQYDPKQRCDLWLSHDDRAQPMSRPAYWRQIWEGGRKGERSEYFRLYRKSVHL